MTKKYGYWVSTTLLALFYLAGAAYYFSDLDGVRKAFSALGYPTYLVPYIAVVKLLAAIAVVSRVSVAPCDWNDRTACKGHPCTDGAGETRHPQGETRDHVDPSMKSSFNARSTTDQVLGGLELTGKTVLLTGCNSGLGFETLRQMTGRGAHVIAAARNLKSAQEACAKVGGSTTPLACDLSDLSSMRQAIATVRANGRPVDIVIANAGIMALPDLERIDGLEKQFVVNYLAHFMLVTGILDMIPRHAGARIVILASSAHTRATPAGIEFDNLSGERGHKPWVFYGQSNVARILFARALSRRLSGAGIAVNTLHPGVIADTNLARNLGVLMRALAPIARLFTKTIPQGAATQCYLAAHPEVAGITGEYFSDCRIAEPSPAARDDAIGERLWALSEQLVAAHRTIEPVR